jgi:hypothetical protein
MPFNFTMKVNAVMSRDSRNLVGLRLPSSRRELAQRSAEIAVRAGDEVTLLPPGGRAVVVPVEARGRVRLSVAPAGALGPDALVPSPARAALESDALDRVPIAAHCSDQSLHRCVVSHRPRTKWRNVPSPTTEWLARPTVSSRSRQP